MTCLQQAIVPLVVSWRALGLAAASVCLSVRMIGANTNQRLQLDLDLARKPLKVLCCLSVSWKAFQVMKCYSYCLSVCQSFCQSVSPYDAMLFVMSVCLSVRMIGANTSQRLQLNLDLARKPLKVLCCLSVLSISWKAFQGM